MFHLTNTHVPPHQYTCSHSPVHMFSPIHIFPLTSTHVPTHQYICSHSPVHNTHAPTHQFTCCHSQGHLLPLTSTHVTTHQYTCSMAVNLNSMWILLAISRLKGYITGSGCYRRDIRDSSLITLYIHSVFRIRVFFSRIRIRISLFF